MKGIELLKLIIDRKLSEGQLFKMYENGGKDFSVVRWNGTDLIFIVDSTSLNFSQIMNSFFIKVTREEEKVQEIQSYTIRDFIIDETVKDNVYKLRNKLLEIIDKRINILNDVLCGRNEPFVCNNLKDIEEAKELYLKASKLRKLVAKEDIKEFNKLNPEEIIKTLNIIYKENRYKNLEIFM